MEKEIAPDQLEYLLALDFEATCIQDQKIEPCPEIIELPIILLHLPTAQQVASFHRYVRPTINPKLSSFCTELTGITQEMVDAGQPLRQTLQQLDKWFTQQPYLNKNFGVVTCGDWDIRTCLRQQAREKGIGVQPYLHRYINLKEIFKRATGKTATGMIGMLQELSIPHQGRHHSGIDDVRNISNLCFKVNELTPFLHSDIKTAKFPPPNSLNPISPFNPSNCEFQFLLVLDFEATCLENERIKPCSEIIEFPVCVVDVRVGKVVETFHQFVRPRFNPELSPFCRQLTGIGQGKVDAASSLQKVLQQFQVWINSREYLKKDNFVIITCGDWDLTKCLPEECKAKELPFPPSLRRYINLKAYFPKLVNCKSKVRGMEDMLRLLSLPLEGHHHSGIDDVRNLCRICLCLLQKYQAKFGRQEVRTVA